MLTFSGCTDKVNNRNEKTDLSSYSQVSVPETDFEAVEITLDNYQDYFEIKERFYAEKDSFGDYFSFKNDAGDDIYTNMTYGVYLALKNKYEVQTGYGKSSIILKLEYTTSLYGFDFNPETGEGTVLEAVAIYDDVYQKTENFKNTEEIESIKDLRYAATIYSRGVDTWTRSEGGYGDKYRYAVRKAENINITGIQGTLYVKEVVK